MRMIDADALLKSSGYNVRDCSIGAEYIISAPTVDAAPVVHGRLGYSSDRPDTIICSCCDRAFDVWKHESKDFFYCPHCGAKMDLPEKENTK